MPKHAAHGKNWEVNIHCATEKIICLQVIYYLFCHFYVIYRHKFYLRKCRLAW
jgi:hypothetical protein